LHIADGVKIKNSFSMKYADSAVGLRPYVSIEEKLWAYLEAISGPAREKFPDAPVMRGVEVKSAAQGSPLRIPDTSSARYNVVDYSSKLRGKKVGIVGLGGTGSYILDFLARTHLEELHLFDDDIVHVHTVFRIPGFVPKIYGEKKVSALAKWYKQWHGGITPHTERISEDNIQLLHDLDFVFVAVDDGPTRSFIAEHLAAKEIDAVDCGMGLNRAVDGLNGAVRVSKVSELNLEKLRGTPLFPVANPPDDDYRKHAQIAELNALNAIFAVIIFKQFCGVYEDEANFASAVFETSSFDLDKFGKVS
jgi:hypothetical protein